MDVEKWLFEHAWPVDLSRSDSPMAVSVDDLRELLNGKVICEAEPVATTLLPDPYGEPEESSDGVWFSHKDWKQIEALGAGVRLYKAAGDGEGL